MVNKCLNLADFMKFRLHYLRTHSTLSAALNTQHLAVLKKRLILAQVLSCEFCKIFKNTFFTEHLRWLLVMGPN